MTATVKNAANGGSVAAFVANGVPVEKAPATPAKAKAKAKAGHNLSMAQEACRDIVRTGEGNEGARAKLTFALAVNLNVPLVAVRDGARVPFTPRQYVTHDNGKLASAMLDVIFRDVCGYDGDVPAKVKAALPKCLRAAVYLADKAGGVYDPKGNASGVELDIVPGEAGGKRVVMSGIRATHAMDLYDKEGKPTALCVAARKAEKTSRNGRRSKAMTDAQITKYIDAMEVTASGERHDRFGKLPTVAQVIDLWAKRAVAEGKVKAVKSRKGKNAGDKAAGSANAVTAQINAVAAFVTTVTPKTEGEAVAAATEEQRAALHKLAEGIAAYFVADPRQPLEK